MKKNKKIIASALGATTIAAGMGIAAVAQACPAPAPASDPVTNYYNDNVFTTTNGVLDSNGLSEFWGFYIFANGSTVVAQDNTTLLSNVSVAFNITNIVNTSGSIYNFTFSMTRVTANILGSTNSTTFSPSGSRTYLYQLTIEGLDISQSGTMLPTITSTDGVDSDFLVSAIVERRVFEFYSSGNTNALLDTIVLSSGFSIEGNEVTPMDFRSNVTNFALGMPLALTDITVTPPQSGASSVVSVSIATGSVSYMYPVSGGSPASFTIPTTGPLVFSFDISTDFAAPTSQSSVTGMFEFQVPPTVELSNIWNPNSQTLVPSQAALINAIGLIVEDSTNEEPAGQLIAPVRSRFSNVSDAVFNAALGLWTATGWTPASFVLTTEGGLGQTLFSAVSLVQGSSTATTANGNNNNYSWSWYQYGFYRHSLTYGSMYLFHSNNFHS